ncbi:uncharacterized protein TNCV_909081 [Trichonephila clavipes]|nr:uncharacterized protein TNCV_909081 [Trichonephila clavipes]
MGFLFAKMQNDLTGMHPLCKIVESSGQDMVLPQESQVLGGQVALLRKKTVLNGDQYRAMITNFFISELNNHDVLELWFQQDGATCQTARATIDLLKDTFGDCLSSRFGPVN